MGLLKSLFSGGILGFVGAVIGGFFTGGLTWGLVAGGALTGMAMTALGSVLAKKPKRSSFSAKVSDRKVTIRAATEPLRVIYGEVKVSGVLVYAESTGDKNEYIHMVLALAGHRVEDIGKVYFNDNLAMDDAATAAGTLAAKWDKWAVISKHLGDDNQSADTGLVNASTKWSSAHRGRGIAYLYLRLKYDKEGNIWPTGLPNVSTVVKGRRVWDPRSDETAYGTNPALCVLDYLKNELYGLGAPDEEIDLQSFKDGADYCDAAPYDGKDTKRFTANGTFSTDAKPRDILDELLSGCGGALAYSRGEFRFCIGPGRPVMTLTGDDLRGEIRVVPRPPRSELFNTVGGTFSDRANGWVSQEFPEASDRRYVDEDGGEKLVRNTEFPFTTSRSEAIRLAGINLQLARQSAAVEFPANLKAIDLKVWDVVKVNIPPLGYADKQFRVMKWKLAADGGIDLTLVEYSPAAYEWAGEFPAADPAPDTNLPDPWFAPPPKRLTLRSGDSELMIAGDGTVIARIALGWEEPIGASVDRYQVDWKESAATAWSTTTVFDNKALLGPVKDKVSYDVRVRAYNGFGSVSEWLEFRGYRVKGKSAPPPKPNWFRVEQAADGTRRFSWGLEPLPADVRAGGGFVIRYGTGSGRRWVNMVPLHEGLLTSSPYESNALAAGSYTFAIKAQDSSKNLSPAAIYITATLGDPRLRDVLYHRSERAEGWNGTKSRCFVEPGGSLIADSGQKIRDLPDKISALPTTFYELGGAVSKVSYLTAAIDLGTRLSFTPVVAPRGEAAGYVLKIYYKDSSAEVFKVQTLAASPATITARYVKFRINVPIGARFMLDDLSIMLDGESKTIERNDLNTAAADERWFKRVSIGRFLVAADGVQVITQASIVALQDAEPGWTWTLKRKNGTINGEPAAEFILWAADKTPTDGVVDVSLKGPAKKEMADAR